MIQDFIFDGRALSDFGYMAVFENSEDVIDVSAMQFNTIKAALSDINHRVSHTYEQNYTSTFLIMKNLCDTPEDEQWMTHDDISEMTRWLARKQYKWFRFIDDEDDDEIWYKVQIQISKEYIGANVVGLQLTVTANAPYGFTREIKKELTNTETDNAINIFSDEEGYIYPNVTITIPQDGDYTITNEYENRTTQINNCTAGEIITIYGEDNQQIQSNIDHDFTTDFNYVFPRFCNKYGNSKNIITAQGGSSIYSKHIDNESYVHDNMYFSPEIMSLDLEFMGISQSRGIGMRGSFVIDYNNSTPTIYTYTYNITVYQIGTGVIIYTKTESDVTELGTPIVCTSGSEFSTDIVSFNIIDSYFTLASVDQETNYEYTGTISASTSNPPVVTPNIVFTYRGIRKVGFER